MVGPIGVALATMGLVAGLVIVIAGSRGALPRLSPSASSGDGPAHLGLRIALAGGGFLATLMLTGWPVAAVSVAIGGVGLPTLATAKQRRREAVERVEAIASWAESLRDTMAASAGIQEALRTTARVAPEPIANEVRDLSLRLQHESVPSALRRFASDMAHPLSDMVVASLIMATARHAGSLQGVLAMIAKSARDSAAMWRHVESGRARVYAQSRMAGWVSFVIITIFVLTRREFLAPFDSIGGQFVMTFICGSFLASGVALYRLGRPVEPRRMFHNIEGWSPAARVDLGEAR